MDDSVRIKISLLVSCGDLLQSWQCSSQAGLCLMQNKSKLSKGVGDKTMLDAEGLEWAVNLPKQRDCWIS